ncbi:ABC transporter permease [Paraburkholderia sediminicola]|uniref:ABC transporter permease n=1 Tax=Paraburkholderia sediminicola TaxID=458836 RepID=UPI0038B71E37
MTIEPRFSLARWWSIAVKEYLQIRRDRLAFAMMLGFPLLRMILFGFALNSDPRHLPTQVIARDASEFTRSFMSALEISAYFDIVAGDSAGLDADQILEQNKALIVIQTPAGFSRDLVKGLHPQLLVEVDAGDSGAVANAMASLPSIVDSALRKNLIGPLETLAAESAAFGVTIHRRFNPENIAQYTVIPGLMGVILATTMVMMTAMAITRERERGTMENLLAMPFLPVEVVAGKILPYIVIGLLQVSMIVLGAHLLFNVPIRGSLAGLYACSFLFIISNVGLSVMLSSFAENQLQAMQLATFYLLPNLLLTDFMVAFAGLPKWAQAIGNTLPLTYFNRIVRAVFLKGAGWTELWPHIWPMMIFMVVTLGVTVRFYRRILTH